ncbi:MAG: thiamine pyrophosphate-binding protein [Stomatobaculum sp.]|nr:thiamine pyrophosphate-binding protein [Stomatobaculum sp.]
MRIKLSNYISQKLVQSGITRAFSVVGGGAMHLNNALGHEPGLTVTYNHHEQASAIAAECYARINNVPACVCVTTGPGGTNAITGVVGAWLDSIPMVVLSGQIRYDWTMRSSGVHIRAMGDQEFDICTAIASMTKYCEMVIDPLRIRFCLEKAIWLTSVGRPGPTWLDIPLDVQGSYIDTEDLIGFDPEDYLAGGTGWAEKSSHEIPEDSAEHGEYRQVMPPKVTEETARAIIDRIRKAERPVFNAGNGIRIADAHKEFMSVARKLGIPVVVGWDSEDCMPDSDPLYAGRPGNFGDRPGNFAVQNADLVFSVGSRLSVRQVGFNWKGWAREAYTIVNDVDLEEIKKPTLHVSMPVHADAKDLLTVMDKVLSEEETPVFGGGKGLGNLSWTETCQMWVRKYPVLLPRMIQVRDDRPANVYAFVREVSSRVKENQITVVGNGSACVVGGHSYIIKKGQRFISNSAIASMGYDLPAAIGAWAACAELRGEKSAPWDAAPESGKAAPVDAVPGSGKDKKPVYERDIILLTGDGSIMMNLQELQTIIGAKMPIKIFLINNDGYHSIRQTERNFFGDQPLVGIGSDSGDLSFPDFGKLAAALGFPYFKAEHNSELASAVEAALAVDGPVICEAFVDTDQNFEPKSSGKRLPDGTMVSPPLEDLVPFLSDEEMDQNMIVPRV